MTCDFAQQFSSGTPGTWLRTKRMTQTRVACTKLLAQYVDDNLIPEQSATCILCAAGLPDGVSSRAFLLESRLLFGWSGVSREAPGLPRPQGQANQIEPVRVSVRTGSASRSTRTGTSSSASGLITSNASTEQHLTSGSVSRAASVKLATATAFSGPAGLMQCKALADWTRTCGDLSLQSILDSRATSGLATGPKRL